MMTASSTPGVAVAGSSVRAAAPLRGSARRRAQRVHQSRLAVRATAAEVQPAEELTEDAKIAKLLAKPYKYGFKTIIESDVFPKGLSEDVVRAISAKKDEPEWLLEFRCGGCAQLPAAAAAACLS